MNTYIFEKLEKNNLLILNFFSKKFFIIIIIISEQIKNDIIFEKNLKRITKTYQITFGYNPAEK